MSTKSAADNIDKEMRFLQSDLDLHGLQHFYSPKHERHV